MTLAPRGVSPYRTPCSCPARHDPLDAVILFALAVSLLVLLVVPRRSGAARAGGATALTCPPYCEVDVAPAEGHRLRATCACAPR